MFEFSTTSRIFDGVRFIGRQLWTDMDRAKTPLAMVHGGSKA